MCVCVCDVGLASWPIHCSEVGWLEVRRGIVENQCPLISFHNLT